MYNSVKMNSSVDHSQMILPFQTRFENALREQNILLKTRYLADLINESFSHKNKEVHHFYVLLIEDIFLSNSWCLKFYNKDHHYKEFSQIYAFLCVDGPLFKLIRHLMLDYNNRYELPSSFVSQDVNHAYSPNPKIHQTFVNAFEFFLFHFADHITKENSQTRHAFVSPTNVDNINILYYGLLENYLDFFLPISSVTAGVESVHADATLDEKSSLWKSLSSTTTNFWNLSSSKKDQMPSNSPFGDSVFNPSLKLSTAASNDQTPKSPMFNSKMFTFARLNANFTNIDPIGNDFIGTPIYKCETVFRIFTELWIVPENRHGTAHNLNVTVEHMRAVRIFIKHLHYFANNSQNKNFEIGTETQAQFNSGGFVPSNMNDPVEDMRRNLWTAKYPIQKKLYGFFKIVFDRWPNDSSFRVPLETWLSYIQPWRYVPGKSPQDDNQSKTLDSLEWKRFVTDNLFFYTCLFRQVICRIIKLFELSTADNTLLVYRVLKVFAQENLKHWIKDSETNLMKSSNLNLPYSSSFSNSKYQSMYGTPVGSKHVMDRDPVLSEYVSVFSPNFREKIIELLLKIARALNQVSGDQISKNSLANKQQTTGSVMDSITNFFTVFSESTQPSKQAVNGEKIKNYLNASIEFISYIFDVPQQSVETILNNARKPESSPSEKGQNIYELSNGVPKLSDYGRNQILNGNLRPKGYPQIIEGNPDTQPVRTFEISILVKLALLVSTILNRKFGPFFEKHYENPNSFYSKLLKLVLAPPVSYVRYVKKGEFGRDMVVERLPARINLRFIASIEFLFYSSLFTTFLLLFYWSNHLMLYLLTTFMSFIVFLLCKSF